MHTKDNSGVMKEKTFSHGRSLSTMNTRNRFWTLWAKSLGAKVGTQRDADIVALFRTSVVLVNFITCLFIIANVIRHW